MDTRTIIRQKYDSLQSVLDERGRRVWAATEARALGRGGQTLVHEATGIARHTIRAGLRELEGTRVVPEGRQRMPGSGRHSQASVQAGLTEALRALVDPGTRGDPMSALCWTTKSLRHLEGELRAKGYEIGRGTISVMLREMGFSLQSTRKTTEGNQHPDRDAQFERIAAVITEFKESGEPAVSVDAKKKELVGDFKQAGQEWQPTGQPEPVRVHDFIDKELGKVTPYGVYDIAANKGWVSVGVSADTGFFATAAVGRWWERLGREGYPRATRLLITADGGGSNGHRLRQWKLGLQDLADSLAIPITVMHLPPGTSKWNKVEHRMFCHITQQFRGRPLTSREVIVELIGHTKTATGLTVQAELDTTEYLKGIEISDDEMQKLNIERDAFHGEWNYTIKPRCK